MQLGIVGLGRMGPNVMRRLMAVGHDCVVFDPDDGTGSAIKHLAAQLDSDDVIIDGGNSHYRDDIARAKGAMASMMGRSTTVPVTS